MAALTALLLPPRRWRGRYWGMSHAQPADVEIGRADLADADQVGMLTERVYRHEGLTDEDYARQLRDGRSRIQDAVVLVAVTDGVIVGTVTAARSGSRLASVARAGEIEVRMLAVDEAARGRGIADRLMAGCEALASDADSRHARQRGHIPGRQEGRGGSSPVFS
jgi:GNAT superfamily N-acetyltransferase